MLPSRELGPRLLQCGLGRGLLPYQAASSSIQPFGHNIHGQKNWVAGSPNCGRWRPPPKPTPSTAIWAVRRERKRYRRWVTDCDAVDQCGSSRFFNRLRWQPYGDVTRSDGRTGFEYCEISGVHVGSVRRLVGWKFNVPFQHKYGYIMGDFNAKVGRTEPSTMSSAVGLYGLGEKNEAGEHLEESSAWSMRWLWPIPCSNNI